MQFKHPELLYALFLLVIPIVVHLFQLRRFQKVEFTNVQFLKNITLQTRKSATIKKWLVLITRLLLLACAVIAFAQPYISNHNGFTSNKQTVIYLDNSFSMQAAGNNGTLLNTAIQELIAHLDENETITLFTNDQTFVNTTAKAIKSDLIALGHSPAQLSYEAAMLKGEKAFADDPNSVKNFVMISDFQQKDGAVNFPTDRDASFKLVQLKPETLNNISIDTVFISANNTNTLELTVGLKNQGDPVETLPISLFNQEQLAAKTSVSITDVAETVFTIPSEDAFDGKIVIEDANLQYDNTLFFNINSKERIKVLSINEADDGFLRKLYTTDEFDYTASRFDALNYNLLESQNLIVLNELKNLPNSLITALKSFTDAGGHIVITPSNDSNLIAYNQLFANYSLPSFKSLDSSEKKITTIHFSHPLLAHVFDKTVSNFQYPKVHSQYPWATSGGSTVLGYEDGAGFLVQSHNVYVFSAPLQEANSNFKQSPLIVPIFYNMGKHSLKIPKLYYGVGQEHTIDISTTLSPDRILTLTANGHSVIPMQRRFANKVELKTQDYPDVAGIFSVNNGETSLQHLSYNFDRKESLLSYMALGDYDVQDLSSSVASALEDIKSAADVKALWKWFVIFALAFLLIEMLILKFLK